MHSKNHIFVSQVRFISFSFSCLPSFHLFCLYSLLRLLRLLLWLFSSPEESWRTTSGRLWLCVSWNEYRNEKKKNSYSMKILSGQDKQIITINSLVVLTLPLNIYSFFIIIFLKY